MKDHIKTYKTKLEKSIGEYMDGAVSERSATAVKSMLECWEAIDLMLNRSDSGGDMTYDDVKYWNDHMMNVDGTMGGHWTVDQTNEVAKQLGVAFDHISEWCWNVTMNMMYSDYCKVAEKFGVGTAEFYGDMAKAFLFDPDGGQPKEKLSAYYHCIVHKGKDK